MGALDTLVDKVHQAVEIMLERVGWTLPSEDDETSRSKRSTTIKTVGKKDGQTVRLVCECGYGVDVPLIKIQDEENYPQDVVERWDKELTELWETFFSKGFRGLEFDVRDPVLYSSVMTNFYDQEPKKTITGYRGWFSYNPKAVY